MLTVFVAALTGPATARATTAASARMSVRMGALFPTDRSSNARAPSVLLTASMSLQTPHRRALVAGGTGRVGAAIVERLRGDGWLAIAAGSADGDLRVPAEAAALVAR